MKKPSNTEPLSHAPLVYVLCQVRFSTVLKIEEKIPEIQEQLRQSYPRFDKFIKKGFRFGITDKSQEVLEMVEWSFTNKDKTTGFLLTNSTLALHTTGYKDFETFAKLFKEGMKIVGEALNVALVMRIGLRYIDFIEPEENKPLTYYIDPGLLGAPTEAFETVVEECYNVSEKVLKNDQSTLVIRCGIDKSGNIIPTNLMPLRLRLDKEGQAGKVSITIDTDHYSENEFEYNLENTVVALNDLHGLVSDSFWAVITESAYKEWK